MKVTVSHIIGSFAALSILAVVWLGSDQMDIFEAEQQAPNYVPFTWESVAPGIEIPPPAYPQVPLSTTFAIDSPEIELPYPISDPYDQTTGGGSGVDFDDPDNIQQTIEYDPVTGLYYFKSTVGNAFDYRPPTYMTLDEYLDYTMDNQIQGNWADKIEEEESLSNSLIPELHVGGENFRDFFGDNTINIRPQGTAQLSFGLNISRTDNPQIPEKQRRITTFDFNEQIQLNVTGTIGTKMKLTTSYNTEATFDFENQMKLEYEGDEDQIIKKFEMGNVSMPLTSSLITGSQSLFGIKTQLQFGRATFTSIFSQQKGQRKEIDVKGGAQINDFEIKADNYEENKHFFLSTFFRNSYDGWMSSLPVVSSPVKITKIEVWITNSTNNYTNNRNLVAFTDVGETTDTLWATDYSPAAYPSPLSVSQSYPDNEANDLYANVASNGSIRAFTNATSALSAYPFEAAVHYEKLENARLLTTSDYTFNEKLGFISLNQALNNDEVLAVAYQYTVNGETYQVGEFSTDGVSGTDALIVKLLKPTITNPQIEGLWDLRMKNVYAIGAYQVNAQNFRMDVWYNDPQANIDRNYIPKNPIDGKVLVQVLNMDKLDQNGSPVPDGVMDFVDNAATLGGTINAKNGRIFFTTVEPFGEHLASVFQSAGVDPNIYNQIVYQALYDSTKTAARNLPELNRFTLKGSYQSSSSSEIYLNAPNIPQGSVQVTANGSILTEGQDYTVDYNLGRVTIINQGLLESGSNIKVSVESNALFSIQTKTLLGTHMDYRFSDDFVVGATWMNLLERPLTQKVNQGDEPINNHIFGVNLDYRTEAPFLTRWVDKLPFYETKEMSTITTRFEAAYLLPGHSKAIGKDGASYIDDFEGSQSSIDLRSVNTWVMASTPKGQPSLFPEGELINDPAYGMNRAKLAWYVIDPLFHRNNGLRPSHMNSGTGLDLVSNNLMRQILETEVFPNKQLATGTPTNIPVLDLAYYPSERGPYNFDTDGVPGISSGIDAYGKLNNPEDRWGGMMREIMTNDFEASNVEFIQFWMMDPFNADYVDVFGTTSSGGDLYFNLGNISEDVLSDGRKSFENGIPVDPYGSSEFDPGLVDTTAWGWVPVNPSIVNAFDTDPDSRENQDVGFDGLKNNLEASFFNNSSLPHNLTYIDDVNVIVTALSARDSILNDPAGDFFHYYRGDDWDNAEASILERYKWYNGMDGNSATTEQSSEINSDGYPTSGTTLPNVEDINKDNNVSEAESYFQYQVSIRPSDMVVGRNYITDVLTTTVTAENGDSKSVKWYQFKIPVRDPDAVINNIQDFRSIRFMRMFLTNFDSPIVLRFARLELIRGEWRRYLFSLLDDGEYIAGDPDNTLFNIGAVNVEENGNRTPINYVVPPQITQEVDATSANLRRLNEQSLVLEVCDLQDGDARAAFKNVSFDVRSYKRLEMYVHGEQFDIDNPIDDDEVTVFIRLGSDFTDNYYEYEMPVKLTDWNESDPEEIWPEANIMDIEFDKLLDVKKARNADITISTSQTFTQPDPNDPTRLITVKGNPNLQGIKTIMIGVRNPHKDDENDWKPDDGEDKCAIIWVNELRLTDFDEQGGGAALANVNAQLADLGNVTLAGSISMPGFGALQNKVSERSRETALQFDAATNIELSKFFGQETRLHLPMYMSFSEGVINPQYDPLNPDILFKDQREALSDADWQDLKKQGQTYTKRRSINFTNIRIDRRTGAKPHFWDLSNWSLTYAYNEQFVRSINMEFNTLKTYRLGLNYTYNATPKVWKPFANVGLFKKSDWFKMLREFNVNLGPKQIGFRNDLFRSYNEQQVRINTEGAIAIPQFTKQFNWTRGYDLKYDISKGIKVTFNANNTAVVGEPAGRVNRKVDPEGYQVFKDSVMKSLANFGETTRYGHKLDVNWTVPLSALPITDWINLNARYSASYQWDRAPFSQDTMGHIIQNSRSINGTAQLNFTNLFNKIPYLKRVNQEYGSGSTGRTITAQTLGGGNSNSGDPDSTDTKGNFKGFDYLARFLMMLKSVNLTYTSTDGTLLPGYGNTTSILGANSDFSAPGWGFLFGEQNYDLFGNRNGDYAMEAARNGWLIQDTLLANMLNAHVINHTENLNGRITLEPINNLRIEISGDRNKADNTSSFFRYNDSLWNPATGNWGDYEHQSLQQTGNFSMSIMTLATAFVKDDDKNVSPTFEQFAANREIISDRLAVLHPNVGLYDYDSTGIYYNGFGGTAQDVVIPAFIAAYTGKDAGNVKLNPFKMLPNPNWRITYDGLGKMEMFKKWFRNVTISHAYRSSFNIGTYTTNLLYEDLDMDGFGDATDQVGNYISDRQITSVSITEQFSPLIMFDMTTKSDLLIKVELKRDRNLTMSLTNNQLTEIKGNEIVVGAGYDFKNVKLKLGSKTLESNLKIRADISIRSNKTITRRLVENQNQITAGQTMISIKTSADYNLNQNLSIRFFFDRVVTKPFISTTFPTANTNAGIALRFTLG